MWMLVVDVIGFCLLSVVFMFLVWVVVYLLEVLLLFVFIVVFVILGVVVVEW